MGEYPQPIGGHTMTSKVTTLRERNPDQTKERLLDAAFEEMHRVGFQAASLDAILSKAGVTKGALYHHFPNKKALGYAVVDTQARQFIIDDWVTPLEGCDNPLDRLGHMLMDQREKGMEFVKLGCPLANLNQEMSGLDEGFRERIVAIYDLWIDSIANALLRGQANGIVRKDVAPEQAATFIVSSMEGALLIAKAMHNEAKLIQTGFALMQYLDGLRA